MRYWVSGLTCSMSCLRLTHGHEQVLAGDGFVYSPGELTMSLDIFKKAYGQGSPPAELTLLPVWEIEKWGDANVKH
jgi:hypothetical protein